MPECIRGTDECEAAFTLTPTYLDTIDTRPPSALTWGNLGQVLAAVEVITEDDTVGCDLVLAREWIMGAAAGFENG